MKRSCEEWQLLFWSALDGELSSEDSRALAGHVRNCVECRQGVGEAVATHRALLEAADAQARGVAGEAAALCFKEPQPQVARGGEEEKGITGDRDAETREQRDGETVLQEGETGRRGDGEKRRTARGRVIWLDWRMLAAAAALVLISVGIMLAKAWRPEGGSGIDISPVTPIAVIERTTKNVFVINVNASSKKPAEEKDFVTSDDRLDVQGAGQVVLRYRDGTGVTLTSSGNPACLWPQGTGGTKPLPKGKHLYLPYGVADFDVVRQSSTRPLIVETAHAEAKVLGTKFRLTVTAESTKLEVTDGRVQLTRNSDGTSVIVEGGQSATAQKK